MEKEIEIYQTLSSAVCVALSNFDESEPQLVANLVWYISRKMVNRQDIKVGGIFVHQVPTVKCGNFPENQSDSVEIGDLLLLRSETGGKNRSALLLQAKKVNSSLPIRPKNVNQHYLYAYWPEFEYVRGMANLKGAKRRITGCDLFDAAQYLLLTNDQCLPMAPCRHFCCCGPRCLCKAITAHPSFPLSHHQCFIQNLTAFILGDAGKPYFYPLSGSDLGWSRVIQDLIDVTGNKATEYINKASGKRHKERMCFLSGTFKDGSFAQQKWNLEQSSADNQSNEPPEVGKIENFEEDEFLGGISIIEFTVTRAE